ARAVRRRERRGEAIFARLPPPCGERACRRAASTRCLLHLSLRERSTAKPAGEGLGNSPDEAVNPHPALTGRPLPQGEVKASALCQPLALARALAQRSSRSPLAAPRASRSLRHPCESRDPCSQRARLNGSRVFARGDAELGPAHRSLTSSSSARRSRPRPCRYGPGARGRTCPRPSLPDARRCPARRRG